MMRVEIHDHQDDVAQIIRPFTVADQLFVVNRVKLEAPVTLEGRVLAAKQVDPGDQVMQAAGAVKVPMGDLVLLRVQIFLGAWSERLVLDQLEDGPVDAIAGAEGGCQDQSNNEGRPAT